MKHVCNVRSVAHQPTCCDTITDRIGRWYSVTRRQGGKLHATADKKCIGSNEERIGALARKGGKGRLDLADCRGVVYLDLQPDGGGGFLYVTYCGRSD